MRRHAFLLLCAWLTWAWSGIGQEVHVNQYTDESASVLGAIVWPGGVRFLWGTSWEFCSRDAVVRSTDSEGRFTSDDSNVFSPCSPLPYDIAADTSGNFLVVAGGSFPGSDILARLFDSTGAPLTGTIGVNDGVLGRNGRAAFLPSGRYVVVWQDDPTATVRGRFIMPDGSTPDPEVIVASGYIPVVAASPSGGFAIAWLYQLSATASEARVQVFDDTFTATSPVSVLNQTRCVLPDPFIGGGPSGYVVTWPCSLAGQVGDTMARYIDLAGMPTGQEFLVNTRYTMDWQNPTACAMDGAGNALITWNSDFEDGSLGGVKARRYDSSGQPFGPIFQVTGTTSSDQVGGRIGMLPSGSFVIAWTSAQELPNYLSSVFSRRYYFPLSLAVAPGPGSQNGALIQVCRPDGRAAAAAFGAYGTGGFGANAGAGNIDGGALDEVLTGPGPSPVFGPHVRAFRPDGTALAKVSYYAYGTLRYGVRPGGGGIDTDAYAEILTAPGPGAVFGPHIRGWDYDSAEVQPIAKVTFFAYNTLRFGARVASGDVDGDGIREILTAPGPGAPFGPQIRGFNHDGVALTAIAKINFSAFTTTGYGCTVASSDVESDGYGSYGDGYQEILAGVGPDPDPALAAKARLFDYDNAAIAQKYEIQPYTSLYGTNVAGGDVDAGDTEEVVTAPGPAPAAPANVVAWEWDPVIGINPDGPRLQRLGPDDFVAFQGPPQLFYGATVTVGTYQ